MIWIRNLIIRHRLAFRVSGLLFALFCLIVGCQSSEDTAPGVNLEWQITPTPPSVGKATLNITLRDSTDQLLTGADVSIEGNMSHPGMQPVLANAEEIEPGVYSAPLKFTMGGDWYFIIESTLSDDRVVKRQINVPGVYSEE